MLSTRQRLGLNHPNLACYYKGPRQLGQFDPVTATALVQGGQALMSSVTNLFSGLFGKDPNKANYDDARGQIWTEFGRLVDSPQAAAIILGTATQSEAGTVIAAGEEFRRQYKALTDQYRGKIDASWLEPRFLEIYDFMTKVINSWRAAAANLSRFGAGATGELFQQASSYWPILLAGAVFLFWGRK